MRRNKLGKVRFSKIENPSRWESSKTVPPRVVKQIIQAYPGPYPKEWGKLSDPLKVIFILNYLTGRYDEKTK